MATSIPHGQTARSRRQTVTQRIAAKVLTVSVALVVLLVGALSVRIGQADAEALRAPLDTQAGSPALPWNPPTPGYRILVDRDGMVALSYADLLAAGLPVDTVNPDTWQLFYMGEEVAIEVTGAQDGSFDDGDRVIFFGRSVDSLYHDGLIPTNKYSSFSTYWLTYGNGSGLRMATLNGGGGGTVAGLSAHTVHLETNRFYESYYPYEENADHWYDTPLQVFGPLPRNTVRTFSDSSVATGNYSATLAFRFLGASSSTDSLIRHFLKIYINNQLIYTGDPDTWTEYQILEEKIAFPQSLLTTGSNSIKLEMTNPVGQFFDKVYPDWLEVTYFRTYQAQGGNLDFRAPVTGSLSYGVGGFTTNQIQIYDVSAMTRTRRITNAAISGSGPYTASFSHAGATPASRYVAIESSSLPGPALIEAAVPKSSTYSPADLLSTANEADYIVISHSDFWDQILVLAQYRARRYRVALIDVQQIYDTFNGGQMSAESIHEFLLYAWNNWAGKQPEFLLLVGDGTADMRNYQRLGETVFIPPYLALVDHLLGETTADNKYVLLEGDDVMPDMSLGRFPVKTPEETTIMVTKTMNYEATPNFGDWNQNVLFVADDLEGGGGNFYYYSDILADGSEGGVKFLPAPYTSEKVYMGVNCDTTNPKDADECRVMISDTLNITGALIMSYVGHSSKEAWAGERLMDPLLISQLNNADKLPIILAMTCLEGSYQSPGRNSLAESYILSPNGAVASWSPTGLGVATGHDLMEQGFFLELFHNNVQELGRLTTAGKRHLFENQPGNKYDDLLETFILFGDPALQVQSYLGPTAVEMAELTAVAQEAGVMVRWRSESEVEMAAFNVLRSQRLVDGGWSDYQTVNAQMIVAQNSGLSAGAVYEYMDPEAQLDQIYRYALQVFRPDGSTERFGEVEIGFRSSHSLYLPIIQ